ncbi:GL23040 [Drosophila persimilis]|uniref:GL23040 n=1 Tax=Drosophila persimilis TaxID=7234 RepID=B4G3X2_DROPE|nr:GL23040 [Drosophila persimilis]
MIDLEDLPRLQSLSPARDIDDYYPQTLLEPILMDPNPKKKVTVRVPIGPPSKMAKLIKPTVASTPSTPSLETPPTPVVQSTRNLTWRGEFQFTTLVSHAPNNYRHKCRQR